MKKIIVMLLFVCCFSLQAEPLVTPHTFTAGTPAQASQVNANFQAHAAAINSNIPKTIVKQNGVEIGWFYSFSTDSIKATIVTTKNAFFDVDILPTNGLGSPPYIGLSNSNVISTWFNSNDCTGQPYIRQSSEGMTNSRMALFDTRRLVFKARNHQVYYTQASSLTSVSLNSTLLGPGNCYQEPHLNDSVYPAFVNDSSVTGVEFTIDGSDQLLSPLVSISVPN